VGRRIDSGLRIRTHTRDGDDRGTRGGAHLFLIGKDYHLGDLLCLTAVLAAYRRRRRQSMLLVGCPDRPISRILEASPVIDAVLYGDGPSVLAAARARHGRQLVVHDLRPVPIAWAMLRAWRERPPWLYYRDLWLGVRGQWLATFLHLGRLDEVRPVLRLEDGDRVAARTLPRPYVVLAPHTGHMAIPVLDALWGRLKGWGDGRWRLLARGLRRAGYTPVTLAAAGEAAIPGTVPAIGLPIRQAAGIIEGAAALVTVESGLWYIAAAVGTPLVIVPWWLPRSVDWAAPMGVPYRLIRRDRASIGQVLAQVCALIESQRAA
jgi:hypothetical protein